jgi:subfamily B ATP-binding cassette protein MsbA
MRKYSSLIKYFVPYKKNIVLYILSVLLSVIFGLVSITMLLPFMELIFKQDKLVSNNPITSFQSLSAVEYLKFYISKIITKEGRQYALGAVCVLIASSVLLKNLFLYISIYMMNPIRNGVMVQVRNDLYKKVLTLPIGYFTEQKKGDLISRMTNDTWELEATVSSVLDGLIKDPATVLVYLCYLVYLSPQLSLILLVLLPIAGIVIGKISKTLKKQSNAAAEKSSEGLSVLEETISGMRIIKAFNAEVIVDKKFTSINNDLFKIKNKMNLRRELASPLSEIMGVLVLCVILWFGGKLVLGNSNSSLTAASFIIYIAAFTQIINPAKSLSNTFYNIQKGTASLKRIEDILQTINTVEDNKNGIILNHFSKSIEFNAVNFAYNDVTILNNIQLNIEKGKTVALVGSSGSGKSTLADLIPRFHDALSGTILIDGKDIKGYTLKSIRNQISIVTQEAILFNDTIANNILLGNPNATHEEVIQAAKIANAYNFIMSKEEGFDTNIGDRGNKLSGGEKQRITIARAILKNPPILILDEATSALDTESERLVQDAINNLMHNRTSIVIAHRLSTIRHADEIIVLQKGNIAERGNHDTLMAQGGIYKRLIDMQEIK